MCGLPIFSFFLLLRRIVYFRWLMEETTHFEKIKDQDEGEVSDKYGADATESVVKNAVSKRLKLLWDFKWVLFGTAMSWCVLSPPPLLVIPKRKISFMWQLAHASSLCAGSCST